MRILLDRSVFIECPAALNQAMSLLREDCLFLQGTYPNFDSWLSDKVIPGIVNGERTLQIELRDNQVAAFMILKHTTFEKKLCTLRVRPKYESLGMGVRLFERAFEVLETERPLLSVSESAVPKFESLFRHFGFSQEAKYEDRYLPSVCELSYNGFLDVANASSELSFHPTKIPSSRKEMPFADTSQNMGHHGELLLRDEETWELLTA